MIKKNILYIYKYIYYLYIPNIDVQILFMYEQKVVPSLDDFFPHINCIVHRLYIFNKKLK